MSENRTRPESPDPIAIIGMSLRVPGAKSPEQLWENLVSGTDSITHFRKEDLDFPEEFDQEGYVPARGIVEGIENFDASFFGILPKEAEIMDPQQRHFLGLAWEVVERAGYAASRIDHRVGVYAGTYMNSYLLANLCSDRQFLDDTVNQARVGSLATEIASDKDYLATRVAYKMNLNGPAMTVGTACSTSLVAVAEACRAIRDGLCEMALAGGVTLTVPYRRGYTYTDKGINSIDGRCRVFDKEATGTVFSNGAGVVLLKKLSDAQRDGDHIHAVIRGVGLNNDGSNKVSFAAPSVKGQVAAIRAAQLDAGVDPETISLIEAHGTGTPLGDPIEVRALNRAFKEAGVTDTGFCALGSLKSYIGHLDVAAGVCGLIKTALSLENKKLPALLHFREPHPKIKLEDSPFYPVAELTEWNRRDEATPLRAGISSFGVGGTNAHLVLEEAASSPSASDDGIPRLVPISAKTPEALAEAVRNLHEAISSGEVRASLPDLAWTLATGREEFPYRCSFVASTPDELADATASFRPGNSATGPKPESVSFLFPGQGSQQVNMARSLYESAPEFRKSFDRCCEILQPILKEDLSAILFPSGEKDEAALQERLRDTGFAQPAIFAVEYSLALWWMKCGLRPDSMVGHSVGEFVAACLAGVFSLEDALRVVATRGQLMSTLPAGSMLSVRLEERALLARLPESLDLAASNAPGLCVVAGPDAAIADFQKELEEESIPSTPLHTSHAFHSRMMDPAVEKFRECLASIPLQSPRLPILSTVTADWLTEEQATDANYWAAHLRETVRFGDAIAKLAENPGRQLFLEVGPGQTLLQLTNLTLGRKGSAHLVLPSCSHPKDETPDLTTALETAGKIWSRGLSIAWDAFYEGTPCQRVPLPTYPFQRKRHWIEPSPAPGNLPLLSIASSSADSPATPDPAPDRFPSTSTDNTASPEFTRRYPGGLECESIFCSVSQ